MRPHYCGAIITGAATRLGIKISLALASAGFNIIAHYNSSKNMPLLVEYITSTFGVKCLPFCCDLQDFSTLEKLMSFAFEKVPECNVLVNSASIFIKKNFQETTPQDLDANYKLHIKAPLFLSQYFAKSAKYGSIVNIIDESVHTKTTSSYFSYLLSKKSLDILTTMMKKELSMKISVNAVYPPKIPDDEFSDKNLFILNGMCKIVTDEVFSYLQMCI